MKSGRIPIIILFCIATVGYVNSESLSAEKRLLVIDSYHREYRLSQETHKGFCEAMLKLGYLDNRKQIEEFTNNDYVETSKAIVKKLWMDTKREDRSEQKIEAAKKITAAAKDFKPDLIFLGEDNAANYIGQQFLDSDIPIVFWGVNNTPVKYGLVDSKDRPGHNVTGVYQSGYYAEGLELLKKMAPGIKTFAVLSDETDAGRAHYKIINHLARAGALPVKLVETRATNSYEEWKDNALELQKKIDAFFIAQYSGLKDITGRYVTNEEVTGWYISHIKIPEVVTFKFFVEEGMLCAADDAGYNQGFYAVVIAHDILANGADPATYPPRTPHRGPFVVNKQRAEMLGIKLSDDMGIEEYVEAASGLKGKKSDGK